MAEVWFFEKPGCVTNNKQKQLLAQSGHVVHSMNLLEYQWTTTTLLRFLDGLPVTDWFNPSARQIKDGSVQPQTLTEEQALQLLIDEPILIRRPLLHAEGQYMTGFDIERVAQWIGLRTTDPTADYVACSKP